MWRFSIGTATLSAARLALAGSVPLSDDEAYYWVWSRHLAAGYFDHPPLVAWLVALSTSVLGISLLALRLPFVVLGTFAALLLRALVTQVTGDRGLAERSALLFQVVPVFFGLGLLVIPDTPLLVAWLLFALAAWRCLGTDPGATRPAGAAAWIAIGLALGLGLLSKYIAILLPLSLAGWLVRTRRWSGIGVLLGAVAVAALLFAPVVWWNALHDWASLRFQFASRHQGAELDLGRLGLYLGSQALYLSPLLFALAAPAALRLGPWKPPPPDAGTSFLWWMAAPTLGMFLLASLVTEFKPNWPAPGYATLIPLVLRGLDRWKQTGSRWSRPLERIAIGVSVAAVAIAAAHLARPFLPLPAGADPTADCRGWPAAAACAQRAAVALAAERRETRVADARSSADARAPESAAAPRQFFAAGRYQTAARLEFHLPGHPQVICLNPGRDAYDDWQDLDSLRGADFVFVASSRFPTAPDRLVPVRTCREFEQVQARAGPRAMHRITIYACGGMGEAPARAVPLAGGALRPHPATRTAAPRSDRASRPGSRAACRTRSRPPSRTAAR